VACGEVFNNSRRVIYQVDGATHKLKRGRPRLKTLEEIKAERVAQYRGEEKDQRATNNLSELRRQWKGRGLPTVIDIK
jgi:division protein CdvB (Snf7/Vps24/ESCRT-III family)